MAGLGFASNPPLLFALCQRKYAYAFDLRHGVRKAINNLSHRIRIYWLLGVIIKKNFKILGTQRINSYSFNVSTPQLYREILSVWSDGSNSDCERILICEFCKFIKETTAGICLD
jgi:hypothetical protein